MALNQILPNFSKVEYPDSQLAIKAKHAKWRGPIIIDELPSILQKFIDHDAKQTRLHLVFCGSSQRWTANRPTVKFVNTAIENLKSKGIPPIKRHSNIQYLYVFFLFEKPKGWKSSKEVKVIDAKQVIAALK